MISLVHDDRSTWADIPQKFEAGTPAIAEVSAFSAALDYLDMVGMEAIRDHEVALTAYALDRLATVPGIRLFGPPIGRAGLVSFLLPGVHAHDRGPVADRRNSASSANAVA